MLLAALDAAVALEASILLGELGEKNVENGSKIFSVERVSTCEIAGAIALCVIHDLRVNLFRFSGFPQILVEHVDGNFEVTISVAGNHQAQARFVLTRAEAMKAAKAFKKTQNRHEPVIFDRVQQALADVVG
jgi:hypothetical protein